MVQNDIYTLGIDIGSTTVKIAVLDQDNEVLFSDYERHFANIRETLLALVQKAHQRLGQMEIYLIFLVVPFINLVPSTSLRSSPDLAD